MKVLTALGLVITLVLSSTVAIALADSSTPAGSGTSADPYIITTAAQLADIPTFGMSAFYKLENDIDLSSYGNWTPIGSSGTPFKGVFDGNKHEITGLTIDLQQVRPLFIIWDCSVMRKTLPCTMLVLPAPCMKI